MIKVVILVLTTWNTADGTKLFESRREFDGFAVTGNRIEECRRFGVREAHRLTDKYKAAFPWASSNVNCFWEKRAGAKA